MEPFVHLHTHTEYSVLDGMSSIPKLVKKAVEVGMPGMAITDHGVMYGIKEFFDEVRKVNKELAKEGKQPFKPILGCEMYVARRGMARKEEEVDHGGWHLIVLAKNLNGYKNLIKLVSDAWVDGYYDRPRTDHEHLEKYKDDLIVCSACIEGEIPSKILDGDIEGARKAVEWHKAMWGDDFYLELQRHEVKDHNQRANREKFPLQQKVNRVLIEFAKEYGIKLICSNDCHFVNKENAEAHDHLLCLATGKDLDDPTRMLYTKQEWFKTQQEMNDLFADVPEALRNTMEIFDKVEAYSIEHAPLMPVFPIPEEFGTEQQWRQKYTEEALRKEFGYNESGEGQPDEVIGEMRIKKLGGYDKIYHIMLEADYLAKLTYEGAQRIYGSDTPRNLTADTLIKGSYGVPKDVEDRIRFELHNIKIRGFASYFLVWQDIINAARNELGVLVGPGRGSAAGSIVAYCLGITKIDPLKYDLLFERFLNFHNYYTTLPDIDTDFDDDGRGKVLQWVMDKYGHENCAHIITYGTMNTKNSIKDVARVEKLPLDKTNALCRAIPDRLPDGMKMNLGNAIICTPELQLAEASTDPREANTIKYARMLEGTVRNVGIHACGFIICRDPIASHVPVSTADDPDFPDIKTAVTQYDGHVIESTGLIKMDFLGLKTLSEQKEACRLIKLTRGIDLDLDHIPIDDEATYQLYQKGQTIGTFQFESAGMQKYLRELHPTVFEDLIAMNALYRPGPMDYIPSFIARKNGREPITYDIDCMEKYLKDTYGITVYQEQVMLLSRQLANFTRSESDALRKAMGQKKKDIVDAMKPKFIEGGKSNGHDPKVLEKIWADWEKFASYAFNKSHAACYSWVAYQTAYLKANYPQEFMAALLTCRRYDIKEITKLMDECKSMGIATLGPDVNESYENVTINQNGDICMGLSDVKYVGDKVAEAIISERNAHGPFDGIFDFVERVPYTIYRGNTLDMLATGGAFSCFTDIKPQDWLAKNEKGDTPAQILQRYGEKFQKDKQQYSGGLFGGDFPPIPRPQLPKAPVATPPATPATGTDTKNTLTCKYGTGVEKDEKKGVEYVKILAEQGDWASRQYLGFLTLKQEGEDGDIQAQMRLATMYFNGKGVGQSYTEALNWAMKAALQGNAEAQSMVGHIYYYGAVEIERNYGEAAFWLTRAAEQGRDDAQNLLAVCYLLGQGVKKDDKKAFMWSLKSAKQWNMASIYNVGMCYKSGIGVKQDFGKSVEWFSRGIPNDYAVRYGLGQGYPKITRDKRGEKRCPCCGKKIEKIDFYCYQTWENGEWSDLRHAAPQNMVVSIVQQCPHCGNYFTVNDEFITIDANDDGNFIEPVDFSALLHGALSYCSPMREFKWYNPTQEFNQRMCFLWAYNDYFYRNESEHPEPDEMARLMHHHNVMELLKFIENPLLQCDYLRMAGHFDECISRVDAIRPYVVDESVPMLELVKQKAQMKDSAPYKLSEQQPDDVLPF